MRVYPYGTLAAHLIGYLGEINEAQLQRSKAQGYVPGDIVGQSGLEHAYEGVCAALLVPVVLRWMPSDVKPR